MRLLVGAVCEPGCWADKPSCKNTYPIETATTRMAINPIVQASHSITVSHGSAFGEGGQAGEIKLGMGVTEIVFLGLPLRLSIML